MSAPRGEIIRARMICNWCSPEELIELFNRMTSAGNYEWAFTGLDGTQRRLRMVADGAGADYTVIINAPPPGFEDELDSQTTVIFQMEPEMWSERMRPRWGEWASPSPLGALQVRDHRRYRNSSDWWLGLTHRELTETELPPKQRDLAACVSAKYDDPGQRRRVDFLRFLDERAGQDIDIYGSPENEFRNARGPTPAHDKREAVLRYRYYFDAENHATPNFFTEKIIDSLLAETLCFYWGAPNLDSFIDPRAFIQLELDDFEADAQRIEAAIAADEWSARLPFIRAEKRRVLSDLSFFPTLARVLDPARRSRSWAVSERHRQSVDARIGARRAGCFVEISDRTGRPEESETLDLERRLDWTGLVLERDSDRLNAVRPERDCIVAADDGQAPIAEMLERNAIAPTAIDWLNLAVRRPSELIGAGARLDPAVVKANLVSLPLATADERDRCLGLLEAQGYERVAGGGEGAADAARIGRDDIHGVYHLCTIGNWREILAEQVECWEKAGLTAATTSIQASVVGEEFEEGVDSLRQSLGERLVLAHADADRSPHERPALAAARELGAREPLAAGCWYMHSKGVSRPGSAEQANVADWRRFMEHHLAGRWQECVAALAEHDVCGVNWHREPVPHFSGNFWWARPHYLASLPPVGGLAHLEQEAWVGSNRPLVSCLGESGVDHYAEPYPPAAYA